MDAAGLAITLLVWVFRLRDGDSSRSYLSVVDENIKENHKERKKRKDSAESNPSRGSSLSSFIQVTMSSSTATSGSTRRSTRTRGGATSASVSASSSALQPVATNSSPSKKTATSKEGIGKEQNVNCKDIDRQEFQLLPPKEGRLHLHCQRDWR